MVFYSLGLVFRVRYVVLEVKVHVLELGSGYKFQRFGLIGFLGGWKIR